jgi:hypothetical protein
VHFPSRLCAGCTLTGGITLEDYGAVKDVPAEREMEMFAVVGFEAQWFHGREFVDGCEHAGCH